MLPERFASLVNLAGFVAALALYAMLLAMVIRNPRAALASSVREPQERGGWRVAFDAYEPLLVAAAGLGLCWNLGALWMYVLVDLGAAAPPAIVSAVALTALGFLPAVVVHAAVRPTPAGRRGLAGSIILVAGYLLAAAAGLLHLHAAATAGMPRSTLALRLLTIGFFAVALVLGIRERRRVTAYRTLSLVALAVFAVSALHLAEHEAVRDSWIVEIAGHHSSLPLVLAILYQEYPFALADLFLKRALALIVVIILVLASYVGATAWTLPGERESLAVVLLIGLCTAVTLLYPSLRRGAHWFVDAVVLRRPDYGELRTAIALAATDAETPEAVLKEACRRLVPAVAGRQTGCWCVDAGGPVQLEECSTSGAVPCEDSIAEVLAEWEATGHASVVHSEARKTSALVVVPTAEPPRYVLTIGMLAGGRRLLSDDIAMLGTVAHALARRIDIIRLTQERCDQRCREAEVRRLATEAELRALRAQVNPHFLFNALTTVGYLIQTSPQRALEKLVQLTGLLRRVLRSEGEFTTLGQELELVRLYLDIEGARFEERLQVSIDAPSGLRDIRVPTFVLQPLVENAVKHGIAPSPVGGLVEVRARLEDRAGSRPMLCLTVRDPGRVRPRLAAGSGGIGLQNLEQRLKHHYADQASILLECGGQTGTTVTVRLPAQFARAAATAEAASREYS